MKIRDPAANQRQQALEYMKSQMGTYTALTRHDPGPFDAHEDLATAVKYCWLVIEAVPEKLDLKTSTFADLEALAPRDCIFASNSSSFKSAELVTKLNDETKRRVLNTHYMVNASRGTSRFDLAKRRRCHLKVS